MTADGYYTSRIGLVQELGYKGNTVLRQFPECTHPSTSESLCATLPRSRTAMPDRSVHGTDEQSDPPQERSLRGLSAATALSYSRVLGANDRIQLGVIGCGDRGRHDMGSSRTHQDVDVIAVCDIYGAQDRRGPAEGAARQNVHRPSQASRDEGNRRRS